MSAKKSGPNLYEVLRETMKRQGSLAVKVNPAMNPAVSPDAPAPEAVQVAVVEEEAPPPTPEESAPAPAPVEEVAATAVEPPAPEPAVPEEPAVEEPEPEPEPAAEAPPPPPPPLPAATPVAPGARWWGLGERTVEMTYNTVAFGALIVVAALFAAYSAGLNRGRQEADVAAAPVEAPAPPEPPPPQGRPELPPPPPKTVWRVQVYAWKYDANDPSGLLRRQLERAGLTALQSVVETQASGRKVWVLYCGRFADERSPEAQATLRKIQEMRFGNARLADHARLVPVP
jgi:hypothetical protein